MANKMTARSLAVEILNRVETEGAYVNLLLINSLGALSDGRDRYLTTAIVNGTLKNRLTLDYILRRFLTKPLSSLPHEVRGVLRSGAFQLLFLDRIPGAAAVNEAVELTKRLAPRYSSLVNSVLRRVSEQGWKVAWPDAGRDPARYLAVRYSHPEWLVRRWLKRWGFEETEALCRINNEPAPTWIRTNTLKTNSKELARNLMAQGITVEAGQKVPGSLIIRDYGALEQLEAFKQGLFTVQDESSQLIAYIADPKPGQRVLDVCSAPGGKTTHLAQMMQNQGHIYAYDVHEHKLTLVRELAGRLGITIIETFLGDARELPQELVLSMDCVLVDAPCSGLGIMRRKADLRWRKTEQDLRVFPEQQRTILESSAACVSPGGELIYSTCTIEPDENFELVKGFRQRHPEFEPLDLNGLLPFALTDKNDIRQASKGMLQLLPHKHGMDGFFLAKFRRLV